MIYLIFGISYSLMAYRWVKDEKFITLERVINIVLILMAPLGMVYSFLILFWIVLIVYTIERHPDISIMVAFYVTWWI